MKKKKGSGKSLQCYNCYALLSLCAIMLLVRQYVRLVHNNCNICNKHAAASKLLIKEVKERVGRLTSVVKQ